MADLSLCLGPEFIACFDSPIVRADSLGATGDPGFPRGPPIRLLSHPRPADAGPPSGASNAATPTAGGSHEQHRATMPQPSRSALSPEKPRKVKPPLTRAKPGAPAAPLHEVVPTSR